jgi:hypothetical protein
VRHDFGNVAVEADFAFSKHAEVERAGKRIAVRPGQRALRPAFAREEAAKRGPFHGTHERSAVHR